MKNYEKTWFIRAVSFLMPMGGEQMDDLILTLCGLCKRIIQEDHKLIRQSDFKSPCDICRRAGYDYRVTERGGTKWHKRN